MHRADWQNASQPGGCFSEIFLWQGKGKRGRIKKYTARLDYCSGRDYNVHVRKENTMADKIVVGCLREDLAVCPGCGSKNIVGRDREYCHCGQCGQALEIRVVSRVAEGEEAENRKEFEQISLF